jgi:hypothetical protein
MDAERRGKSWLGVHHFTVELRTESTGAAILIGAAIFICLDKKAIIYK